MQITYTADIDEEIYQGIGVIRKAFDEIIQNYGYEVTQSSIETPLEVDQQDYTEKE